MELTQETDLKSTQFWSIAKVFTLNNENNIDKYLVLSKQKNNVSKQILYKLCMIQVNLHYKQEEWLMAKFTIDDNEYDSDNLTDVQKRVVALYQQALRKKGNQLQH